MQSNLKNLSASQLASLSAADLLSSDHGFVSCSGMLDCVISMWRCDKSVLRIWISNPMAKIRASMITDGLIVEPSDRDGRYVYSYDVAHFFAEYFRSRGGFGSRVSVAATLRFYEAWKQALETEERDTANVLEFRVVAS